MHFGLNETKNAAYETNSRTAERGNNNNNNGKNRPENERLDEIIRIATVHCHGVRGEIDFMTRAFQHCTTLYACVRI